MKAVQLSFTHRKLQSLSRELYLAHGWHMPRGLLQQGFCDPRNFTLEEWQQAKRRKKDPLVLKAIFQDTWTMSDSRESFANALLEKGFVLARGNRRGFVAVDYKGEVYSLSRWVGVKPKDLRARLGDEDRLPSVETAQHQVVDLAVSRLEAIRDELLSAKQAAKLQRRTAMEKVNAYHAAQTDRLARSHALTREALAKEQTARFRCGLFGLLDRLSGRPKCIAEENRVERDNIQHAQDREKAALQGALLRPLAIAKRTSVTKTGGNETLASIRKDIEARREKFGETNAPRLHRSRRAHDGPSR